MTTPKNSPSIGDRMKDYENVTRTHLYRRTPVIIRLDGKAFHTFTRGMKKPYDEKMSEVMLEVTKFLVDEVQGAEMGYTQSDEISLFLRDYTRFESESWFDNNIQKMVSVSASMATAKFNSFDLGVVYPEKSYANPVKILAFFDARVFNLPKEEVINYFIWRQQDAMRNSVQGLGQEHLSHKTLQGLKNVQVQEELAKLSPPIYWEDCPDYFKYGQIVFKDGNSMPSPLFKENREFLNEYIYIKEAKAA